MPSDLAEAEYLFIVARDRMDLFAYLHHTFAGDRRVRVMRDQRVDEQRLAVVPPAVERRRVERRNESNVAARLRTFGFAVVRLTY